MNALSNLINRLSPSATLAMSQRSAELKAQGVDVINLSVGEPDFNTPDHIKEAAKQAIDDNFSRYSPVPGYPALRQAIVDKLKNENNLEYTINQIDEYRACGINGIHLYALNKYEDVAYIAKEAGLLDLI